MPSIFQEFALITLAAWAVGVAVFILGPRLRGRLTCRTCDAVFYGALALFTLTFALLGVLRHQALNSHAYDLAIYDQVVWNTAWGRPFQSSIEYYVSNFLGDHLSLALVFLAPLYWLYPDPSLLVAIQPLALAVAGVPLYWWSRERLGPGPALALGLAYVLFVPTIYVVAIDFHDIVLAVPLLAFATYYLLKGDNRRFAMFAFSALLVKEEVALILAALGLFALLNRRQWALGLVAVILGLGWFFVAVWVVIPYFNPQGAYLYVMRYATLGSSPGEIVATVLSNPLEVLSQMATFHKARYLLHLLVPLGFLPLAGPGPLLMVLPTLGYLFLSFEFASFSIISQYAAPIVPFLFFAAVAGAARLGRWGGPRAAPAVAAVLLVAGGASYYLHGPGPFSRNFVPERYTISSHAAIGRELMARIPSPAGVVAQSDLAPHLSRRERIYLFPDVPDYGRVDYILLDRKGNRYPLAHSEEAYQRAVAQVLADPQFGLEEERDGYLLLRREEPPKRPQVLEAEFGGRVRLSGYILGRDEGGLSLTLYWQGLAPAEVDYSLFLHLLDPQGRRVAQWDGPPLGPYLPTSRWPLGKGFRWRYSLPLPPDDPPQGYRLELGLYDWQTLERLPVRDALGRLTGNSVAIPIPSSGGEL